MILNWNTSKKECKIANKTQMVVVSNKPNIDFNFDDLFVNEGIAEKAINGKIYKLTEREINLCKEYIDGYKFPDVLVHVVGDDGFYKGNIKINDMKEGDQIVNTVPPSREHIMENGKWEKVILVVHEGGYPSKLNEVRNKASIEIIFTENNKPYRMPMHYEIWDFFTDRWKDTRDIDLVKKNIISEIRGKIERDMIFYSGNHLHTNESNSYKIQIEEAKAYKKDKESETFFIDQLLETREDTTSKEELVEKIIEKDRKYKKMLAKMLGTQQNMIKKAKNFKTLKELDEFSNKMNSVQLLGD